MKPKKDEFKLPYRISHSRGMTKFEAAVLASAYDAVALGTNSDGDTLTLEGTGILGGKTTSFVVVFRPPWQGDNVAVGWPGRAEVLKKCDNPGWDEPSAKLLLTIVTSASAVGTSKAKATKINAGFSIRINDWEPKFLRGVTGVLLTNGYAPHRGEDEVLHAFYGRDGLVNPNLPQQAEAASRALRRNKELIRFFCPELSAAVL